MDFQFKLKSQKVLVTRPEIPFQVNDNLTLLIEKSGATVIRQPVIRLQLVRQLDETRDIVSKFEEFGSIVFVSANGVRFFRQLQNVLQFSDGFLESVIPVAIGNGTESAMRDLGFENVCVCPQPNSRALAGWLTREIPAPYLIVRASRGSEVLANFLNNAEIRFREWVVYESFDVEQMAADVREMIANHELDWVTLTSSAIANSAIRLLGESLRTMKIASLGENISRIVRSAGFEVSVEAESANFEGLVAAMQAHDY